MIHLTALGCGQFVWRFCPTNVNAADVGSRPNLILKEESRSLWLNGPPFLAKYGEPEIPVPELVPIRKIDVKKDEDLNQIVEDKLERLIDSSSSLYVLQKRVAYLLSFLDYIRSKVQKSKYVPPKLDASCLSRALERIVIFVQRRIYGKFIESLSEKSPDAFDEIIKCLEKKTALESKKRAFCLQ